MRFHHLCYQHHHRSSLSRSSTPYSILTLCMYQTTPDHISKRSLFHLDFCLVHFMTTDHLKHPNQTDQSDHSDKQEDKCRIRIVYFVFSKFHKSRDALSRLHFCATNIYSTGREQQNNNYQISTIILKLKLSFDI